MTYEICQVISQLLSQWYFSGFQMELAGKSILTALPPFLAANANSLKVNVLQIFLHLYKCRVHPIFFQESKKKKSFGKAEKF